MLIASWNVNSVRARKTRLGAWLDARQPDVVCLQETKVEDAAFPHEIFQSRGYHVALWGQRTYNGVAIAARQPLSDVAIGLGHAELDAQARIIAATVSGVRVISVYVPNGQSVNSDKYVYKLAWLAELTQRLPTWQPPQVPLAICGDYNVAPADRDVYDPAAWRGAILCSDAERAAFAALCGTGLVDSFRELHADGEQFTWWDHRTGGYFRNRGLRIDMVLLNAAARSRLADAWIDRAERGGTDPSDHAPIGVTLT